MEKIKAITIADDLEYLRKISQPVDILNDEELLENMEILEKYCIQNEVLAMAANQLGILKRIIYLKNTDLDMINKFQNNTASEEENNYNLRKVLINPVILEKQGLTEYWEACASCLDYFGHVYRPYRIKVSYRDLDNEEHVEYFEGIESTVICHEIDHLDGILHIDIADEVLVMPVNERKKFRQDHGYNIISKTGKFDKIKTFEI